MEIVYTYGVFDLLHYGHLKVLKLAKSKGDKLVIGVFSDKTAESFKRKPILTQEERIANIKELDLGEVVLQEDYIPTQEFLDNLGINAVAKAYGAGWGKEVPEWNNIESILLPYTEGISTSEIIKRCQQ
jgi:cytidyltransferase-like protein